MRWTRLFDFESLVDWRTERFACFDPAIVELSGGVVVVVAWAAESATVASLPFQGTVAAAEVARDLTGVKPVADGMSGEEERSAQILVGVGPHVVERMVVASPEAFAAVVPTAVVILLQLV